MTLINQSTDRNPLLRSRWMKPIPFWFLTIETGMLQNYSKFRKYAMIGIFLPASIKHDTTNPGKPLAVFSVTFFGTSLLYKFLTN